MAKPPVHIAQITFRSSEAGAQPLRSHPLGSLKSNQLTTNVGFYHRTSAKGDLPLRLTVNRLRSDVERVWLRASSTGSKHVFGGIRETVVTFRDNTETVTAWLQQDLAHAVVAHLSVTWDWFFRTEPSGPWAPLRQSSRSCIYTTVGRPQPPWGCRRSGRIEIPWSEALDRACAWAGGAGTVEELCREITLAVLQNPSLRYGASGRYGYTSVPFGKRALKFDCAVFLDLFTGRKLASNVVDCSDVASAICTLSNLLGAELYENELQLEPLHELTTAMVRAIGSKRRRTYQFSYHEVAWKPTGHEAPRVWDGCFRFLQSRRQRLAIGLPYSTYGQLLIGSNGRRRPRFKQTRLRRPVVTNQAALALRFKPITSMKLPGWRLVSVRPETPWRRAQMFTSLWVSRRDPAQRRLSIQVYNCNGESEAKRAFRAMTRRVVGLVRLENFDSADDALGIAAKTDYDTLIYFRIGNQISRVMSAGLTPIPIRPEATLVSRWVRSPAICDPLIRLLS